MKKSILLSIKPKYVTDIINGKKTIEIRKTCPKRDLPIDVYIYCTKEKGTTKPLLLANKDIVSNDLLNQHNVRWLNGKVVAKFTLRKVEEIKFHFSYYDMGEWTESYILEHSCLTPTELDDYLQASKTYDEKKVSKVCGYAWHIEDLVIFDKPRELSEFKHICPNIMCDSCKYADLTDDKCLPVCSNQLKRPPQSFCFIESED